MRRKSQIVVLVFMVVSACGVTSCWRSTSAESTHSNSAESQLQAFARSYLDSIFIERGGYWFAAERRSGNKILLVRFNRPSATLNKGLVSETDRMNGVALRYSLTFECAQWSAWDREWSEWQKGTDGAASFVNTFITGGGLGYGQFVLELKHGKMTVRNMMPIHDFISDRAKIVALMDAAGIR